MSDFYKLTKNPKTGQWENATWFDNYFGQHHYGVQFPDGKIIYDPDKVELETDNPPLSNKPDIDDSDKLSLKHQVMIRVAGGRTPSELDLETAQSILEATFNRIAAEAENYMLDRPKSKLVRAIPIDKLKAIMEIKE